MSTPTLARPTTARTFLFGPGGEQIPVTRALSGSGALHSIEAALGALAAAAERAVLDQFASSVDALLDFDLMGLLASGWQKYAMLTAAARRTLDDPTTEEMVDLLAHKITSVQRPTVDLYLDEVRVGTLHLEVEFEFVVKAVVAEVRAGRLVALRHGECEASGTLSAEGIQVAHHEGRLPLELTTGLGAGIPLLAEEPPAEPTVVLPEA